MDGAHLRLTSTERKQLILSVFPAPAEVTSNGGKLRGRIQQPVAAKPEDRDFEKASVWRIELPAGVDLGVDPLLRLDYVGDVARVLLNGKLVTDDFYHPFTPS